MVVVSDSAQALGVGPGAGGVPGAPVVRGARAVPWRDYVTLTKPRIMSLLVLTAVCAMVAAAGGAPSLVPLMALVDRWRTRVRRGERAQPRDRP